MTFLLIELDESVKFLWKLALYLATSNRKNWNRMASASENEYLQHNSKASKQLYWKQKFALGSVNIVE